MFVPLGSEGLTIDAIKFRLNMYSGPGYLNALLGIIAIMLLVFIFQESKLTKSRKTTKPMEPLLSIKRMKQSFASK